MKLLLASDYYQDLLDKLPKAQKRIVIHAMVLLWGGRTETLLPYIEAALQRGVEVLLVGDVYSKYEAKTAKIARRGLHFNWERTVRINQKLAAQGARITYIGKLGLNPFRGRCHSKITIIDDTVYTFGGVNFSDSHISYQDLMLRYTNPAFANRIYNLIEAIAKDETFPDISEPIDSRTTLLYDGGTPRSSVIYETACQVLSTARKVYYVSKMCPSGRIARLLSQTDHACYFNRPAQEGPPENMAIIFDQLRTGIKNRYTRPEHMHAKCILTEDMDGSRHLISGSNNFSWRGIAYGTKEIAVHSTDPALWSTFYSYLQKEIM